MEQLAITWQREPAIYSVSELNARIRAVLDGEFGLVQVAGEISGTKLAGSGHYYFTLKDRTSQIRCACFRMTARFLKFKPQDGVAVVARGRIDVYESRGEYQLLVESLEPQGHGALQFAFEELKKKLQAEGLFDAARKRPLPKLPRRIGIVTSPAGAVIQDMLRILERRFPGLHIRLYPALVQGAGSVEQLCGGLRYFSESGWAQVVIVARGGGSLEDLWSFNEEVVARHIAQSAIPVISAVGHETDFTIADFVADLRAPTPSAAAELVICTREQVLDQVDGCERRLAQASRYRLGIAVRRLHERGVDRAINIVHRAIGRRVQRVDEAEFRLRQVNSANLRLQRQRVDAITARLARLDLRLRFADAHRRLDQAQSTLTGCIAARLARLRGMLDSRTAKIEQLSPERVLDRGYAIVRDAGGHVIKDASGVSEGETVKVRVAKGEFSATVGPA